MLNLVGATSFSFDLMLFASTIGCQLPSCALSNYWTILFLYAHHPLLSQTLPSSSLHVSGNLISFDYSAIQLQVHMYFSSDCIIAYYLIYQFRCLWCNQCSSNTSRYWWCKWCRFCCDGMVTLICNVEEMHHNQYTSLLFEPARNLSFSLDRRRFAQTMQKDATNSSKPIFS